MRSIALCAVAIVASCEEDIGFLDWFKTQPLEVYGQELRINGTIPEYINGLFVQTGPGQFEMGDVAFGHSLDGFAKTIKLEFEHSSAGPSVKFTTKFLQSEFYTKSKKLGRIAPGMIAAETRPPTRKKLGLRNMLGANDNNYIKAQRIGDTELCTSDTMYLTVMENAWESINKTITPMLPGSMRHPHWQDHLQSPDYMCIQATLAHGHHEAGTGAYLAAMGCQTENIGLPHYHVVFRLDPSNIQRRELVAKVPLPHGRRPSYMHSTGLTENFMVMVGMPYYMDMISVMKGIGLAEGALVSPPGDTTLFQVVRRHDGSHRTLEAPGFMMGHILNCWEEGDDVVLDLSHYTIESGGFFTRYLLDVIEQKQKRDSFQRTALMRYRIKSDDTVEQSLAIPDEPDIDIELMNMNPNYEGKKYCVLWAVQWHAGNRSSFAATALVKRNICTGEKVTAFEENHYVAEHRFVPRPGATEEDDGALVGIVHDGARGESYMRVLDAKTLTILASAPLGMRVPMPIHSTWYGNTELSHVLV